MSASAGTPAAPSTSMKVARVGGVSLEPSPASTYGESVTSDVADALPQTPTDDTEVLTNKLAKLIIPKGDAVAPVELYTPPGRRQVSPGFVRGDIFAAATGMTPNVTERTSPNGFNIKSSRATEAVSWRANSSDSSDEVSPTEAARRAKNLVELKAAQVALRPENARVSYGSDAQVTIPPILQGLVRPDDAQAVFPPSSCVFVANLYAGESDENLTVYLTRVFRQFGNVWVKVRRDARNMPFAFCQYSNDFDAERAIRDGRGTTIVNRACRCEKAKAHRLFFFERKYGPVIGPHEVEQMLRQYGRITTCRVANAMEQAQYNLNEGVVVQFELYEHGQVALQAFRNHETFKMQSLAHMNSPVRSNITASNPANRLYLESYEIDKKSVFVGNLSADIDEAQLKEAFEQFGPIVKVTVHKNESTVDASQKHCFGFVEFEHQPSAPAAIEGMAGVSLAGKTIKVSQKNSEMAKARSKVARNVRPAARAPQQVSSSTTGQMSSAFAPFNHGGAGAPYGSQYNNYGAHLGSYPTYGYYPGNPAPSYYASTTAATSGGILPQGYFQHGFPAPSYASPPSGYDQQAAYAHQAWAQQVAYAHQAWSQQAAHAQGAYNQVAYAQGPISAPLSGSASQDGSFPNGVDHSATPDYSSES